MCNWTCLPYSFVLSAEVEENIFPSYKNKQYPQLYNMQSSNLRAYLQHWKHMRLPYNLSHNNIMHIPATDDGNLFLKNLLLVFP
jgi:hypothetical protein